MPLLAYPVQPFQRTTPPPRLSSDSPQLTEGTALLKVKGLSGTEPGQEDLGLQPEVLGSLSSLLSLQSTVRLVWHGGGF